MRGTQLTQMEGGRLLKWGFRHGAAQSRLKHANIYADGLRFVFQMGFSPCRRAHSCYEAQIATRMEVAFLKNVALALAPRGLTLNNYSSRANSQG